MLQGILIIDAIHLTMLPDEEGLHRRVQSNRVQEQGSELCAAPRRHPTRHPPATHTPKQHTQRQVSHRTPGKQESPPFQGVASEKEAKQPGFGVAQGPGGHPWELGRSL